VRFSVAGLLVLTASAATSPARADEMVERLIDKIDDASVELQLGLRTVSLDMVDLRFQPRRRGARVRLGTEGLRLDGDVVWRNGSARISTRLDLRLFDDSLAFKLPDVLLVPRTFEGTNYLELRLPLLEGTF
jgi:hypothetical protein